MGPTRHLYHHHLDQSPNDSGEDSDIQEIAVIMPGERTRTHAPTSLASSSNRRRASPVLKRRKSSPQMDPITIPSHLLGQQAHAASRYDGSTVRSAGPSETNDSVRPPYELAYGRTSHVQPANQSVFSGSRTTQTATVTTPAPPPPNYSHSHPLSPTHSGPQIIGHPVGAVSSSAQSSTSCSTPSASSATPNPQPRTGRIAAWHSSSAQTRQASSSSSRTPRPVSSALAQAVGRRRDSLVLQKEQQQAQRSKKADPGSLVTAYFKREPVSTEYAEEPVLWSPQAPSIGHPHDSRGNSLKITASLTSTVTPTVQPEELISAEDYSKLQPVRPAKQRVAHKPTIPKNKQNRPKLPLGTARKVPLTLRVKYLDVIINEYLNTGHTEEESYQDGLNEEKVLADRAASKSIYVNLVAGLKKKIREKAGISTLPQDDDPKFVNGNKVVSHEEILTGKVRGTFSIERKRKLSDPSDLSEQDLFDRLSRYLVPQDQLEAYGYPRRDPENPRLRMAPLGKDGQKAKLRAELATSYICERCTKSYRIGEDGLPLTTNKCIFHPGHLWNERINRSIEKRYSCCKGDPSAGGCSSNLYHVHRGDLELENYTGYVETEQKDEREPNKHGIYALDCEMSYTTFGLELTRVTVVNFKSEVVYEKLVKPKNPILDYNTKYSGIRPGDLDHVDTTLHDVQRDLLRRFSSKTILIGHSLDSDMRALKIFHKNFIDTAQLFPHKRGLPFKRALRTLMVENLRVIIQEDAGHDSKEDACAAFRLVMWKAKTDVPIKAS